MLGSLLLLQYCCCWSCVKFIAYYSYSCKIIKWKKNTANYTFLDSFNKSPFFNRVLGSLLSAHLLITDKNKTFGDLKPAAYNDELLSLAHDLAVRLMPAFENPQCGIPFPRVGWIVCLFWFDILSMIDFCPKLFFLNIVTEK